MIRSRDPRQAYLLDPWSHLGPKRRRLLEDSWAGLFRQEILPELPVEELAPCFCSDFGRPAKELYTVLGVILLQQMHDLTDLETVNHLAFNQQWHFALDIPSESDAAKYLCPKTLWTMRQKVTELALDTVIFQRVTGKLARVFQVDTERQRLDSVHVKSNMRKLGRLGILAKCISCFLVNLKRRHPELYAALAPELRERYGAKKALECFSQVKPSAAAETLADVARECFDLLSRFAGHPQIGDMRSYRLLERAFHDQCQVKMAAAPEEVIVKPPREVSSRSLQNPSDPDAGYSGHKGQGYLAQVMETYCTDADPKVREKTLNLITHVAVAPASESDSRALLPALNDTRARGLGPGELVADTPYGSDDNCREAAALKVEVVSPPPGAPPSAGLSLWDFQMSPEGLILACPQGEAPLAFRYRKKKERYRVTFSSARCEACPEKSRCPVKPAKKHHYLSYYAKAGRVAARRAYQQTGEFRERYRWRAGVEATISEFDRRTGAKELRVRGQKAVRYCVTLKAAALNILRATAVRLASGWASKAALGSASGFSWLFSRVKEQFRACGAAIIDFLFPDAYQGPVSLKMAA